MRIVLLGPPGSGKAELSQQISDHYGMPVITVSSVMQRAAAEQTELGRLAKEAMDSARVSDELLLALLRIQLPQMDLGKGFILVDLPKNAGQADVLDSLLSDLGAGVEAVLNLEVDRDELMERLVGRITCDKCGAQYNLYINPPMVEGVCDACGARVVRRPDDYEETISNRLRVYEAQMGPLLQYYQLTDKLHRITADKGIPKIWKGVRRLLDGLPPSVAPGSVIEEPPKAAAPVRKPAKSGSAGKKASAKRTGAIEAAVKKAEAGRVAQPSAKKKAAAKKAAAKKKIAAKKAAAKKKVAAKKAAAKPSAVKKVAKKAVAKKKVAKKKVAIKATARKVAAKQVAGKKPAVKKTVAKKPATKKVAAKKAAAKKKAVKKTAVKKAPARRPAAKRPAAKKAATKKAAVRKTTAKKKAAPKKAKKRPAQR